MNLGTIRKPHPSSLNRSSDNIPDTVPTPQQGVYGVHRTPCPVPRFRLLLFQCPIWGTHSCLLIEYICMRYILINISLSKLPISYLLNHYDYQLPKDTGSPALNNATLFRFPNFFCNLNAMQSMHCIVRSCRRRCRLSVTLSTTCCPSKVAIKERNDAGGGIGDKRKEYGPDCPNIFSLPFPLFFSFLSFGNLVCSLRKSPSFLSGFIDRHLSAM